MPPTSRPVGDHWPSPGMAGDANGTMGAGAGRWTGPTLTATGLAREWRIAPAGSVPPADGGGMVAVPLVFEPVPHAGPAVLPGPLGEAGTERIAKGGVGERPPEGDGQPHQDAGQAQRKRKPDSSAPAGPSPL